MLFAFILTPAYLVTPAGRLIHAVSLLSTRGLVLRHTDKELRFVFVVPTAAPENVTVEAMSSSRILVTWGPVPEPEQNGNILGYKVRICIFIFSVYFANKNSPLDELGEMWCCGVC